MKHIRRKLFFVVTGLTGILFVLCAVVGIYVYGRQPDVGSTFHCEKLQDSVRVVRDNWGIPHIEAQNGKDAYFAYGFTLAQDRLFQMELHRRAARGELAEILGPGLVETDEFFRTLMLRHTAQTYLEHEEKIDPEALALLNSFLTGVNHFIETQTLPIEFTLLGIRPRKFTKTDTLAMIGYMTYSLSMYSGMEADSLFSILKTKFPDIDITVLYPEHYLENPLTIMGPGQVTEDAENPDTEMNPPNSESGRYHPPERFASVFAEIEKIAHIFAPFQGSNSWVIGPSRSKSGMPILANDPHIGFSNPGAWYEAHIKYKDYENYGYHLPLLPFPMIAHNKYKAWAITMLANDDVDLYYETFHSKDKTRVMYKGEWEKVRIMEEVIKVKGEEDVTLKITVTPHGPIITDLLEGYSGEHPISLSCPFLQLENPVLDVMYQLGTAKTLEAFEKAVSPLAAPGMNFSYADHEGNIAWWAVGKIAVRPAHVNPREILDGSSGRDEITGYLPFEQNPHLINPADGIIVTANNCPTDRPSGPMKRLQGYWAPSDRAARITELLSEKEKWNLEDLKAVQTDSKSYAGPEMVANIVRIFEQEPDTIKRFTDIEKVAYDKFKSWDYDNRITSVGATLFHFTTYHILKAALEDQMGEELFFTYCGTWNFWNFLKSFLKTGKNPFNIGKEMSATETRNRIVQNAFKAAVQEIREKLGENVGDWQWGAVHTLEFIHPIGEQKPMNLLFNVGPFPVPGAAEVVNQFDAGFGWHDYEVGAGPSTRRLIDYGDLTRSWSILPTGNSGNFLSDHYDDQAEMFVKGEYRMLNFTWDQVEKNKKHEMRLLPQR